MGLTIRYGFRAGNVPVSKAREYIAALRQKALDLPFETVSGIVELKGEECKRGSVDDDPNWWLKTQACASVDLGDRYSRDVEAKQIIGFVVWPGEGCESTEFGLAKYPKTIKYGGRVIDVAQGAEGWVWHALCKTQYASDPRYGGVEHFLHCHINLIRLLDQVKVLGILDKVGDEGGFWEKRDVAALAKEVGEWNEMLASLAGKIQDKLDQEGNGGSVEAPITQYPDFEHLEAKGQAAEKEKATDG